MKAKLKYLKLFEGISQSDIPYSDKSYHKLHISIPSDLTELPEIYTQLTDEITGSLTLKGNHNLKIIDSFNNLIKIGRGLYLSTNQNLTHITGFNNLSIIGNGSLNFIDNPNLTHITGFDNLTEIGKLLNIIDNSKLISMSIPYTIIKSADYKKYYINDGYRVFKSPQKFINSPIIIQECIDKFNPAIHPDVVVKQIIENLELWGEPDTITTIINHILSKGDYLEYIPEQFYEYVDDHYHHLYNAKYANTGARGIAKMNTGRYLGMF